MNYLLFLSLAAPGILARPSLSSSTKRTDCAGQEGYGGATFAYSFLEFTTAANCASSCASDTRCQFYAYSTAACLFWDVSMESNFVPAAGSGFFFFDRSCATSAEPPNSTPVADSSTSSDYSDPTPTMSLDITISSPAEWTPTPTLTPDDTTSSTTPEDGHVSDVIVSSAADLPSAGVDSSIIPMTSDIPIASTTPYDTPASSFAPPAVSSPAAAASSALPVTPSMNIVSSALPSLPVINSVAPSSNQAASSWVASNRASSSGAAASPSSTPASTRAASSSVAVSSTPAASSRAPTPSSSAAASSSRSSANPAVSSSSPTRPLSSSSSPYPGNIASSSRAASPSSALPASTRPTTPSSSPIPSIPASSARPTTSSIRPTTPSSSPTPSPLASSTRPASSSIRAASSSTFATSTRPASSSVRTSSTPTPTPTPTPVPAKVCTGVRGNPTVSQHYLSLLSIINFNCAIACTLDKKCQSYGMAGLECRLFSVPLTGNIVANSKGSVTVWDKGCY